MYLSKKVSRKMTTTKKAENTLINLMAYGIAKDLAQKAVDAGYNLTKIRAASKSDLTDHFADDEADMLKRQIERQPISDDVVERLVNECHWRCCVCFNYDNLLPVVVHHIEEHARTQNNSYENLVVLCPNHHALAHTQSTLGQGPLTAELLRRQKSSFIERIAQMVAGTNVAPGREKQAGEIALLGAGKALENFHIRRVQKVMDENTFVPMQPNPKIVYHLAPLDALISQRKLNLNFGIGEIPQACYRWGKHNRRNNEGIFFDNMNRISPEQKPFPVYTYLQIFKSGIIEAVDASSLSPGEGANLSEPNRLNGYGQVIGLVKSVESLLSIARSLMLPPPGVLFVSYLGVDNCWISRGNFFADHFQGTINEYLLTMDPVDLSTFSLNEEAEVAPLLLPIADALWQASGWPRAFNYDKEGNWIPSDKQGYR